MATYLILANATEQGIKAIKDVPTRIEMLGKTLEAAGGKLIGWYAVVGQYDFVTIVELPGDEAAMTQVLMAGLAGNVRTTTLRAFTAEEFAKIVINTGV
jgi:uncharacterized protein with GYD domain